MKTHSAAAARSARELRARFYGIRDAAGDLARAGVARIRRWAPQWQWQWRSFAPPPGLASLPPIAALSRSAASSVRGVAAAPKVLLLGLLILQLLVLGVLRSAPSAGASHGELDHAPIGRTLYTVAAKNRPKDSSVAKIEKKSLGALEQGQGHLPEGDRSKQAEKKEEEAQGKSFLDRPRGDVSRSAVLDNAASSVREVESKEEEVEDEGGKLLSQGKRDSQLGDGEEELENKDSNGRGLVSQEQQQAQVGGSGDEEVEGEKDTDSEEKGEESKEASILASENAILEEDPVCKGGRIFVYDLPPRFNADLLANCSTLNPWLSLCDALSHGGLGKPMTTTPWPSSKPSPWFYTEQFSGEVIFHTRILRHPCVTNDSDSANVFYVPFYAGLDVSRYLWRPSKAEDRDHLGHKLVEWLSTQPAWTRARGRDHFTMIGRITWDFRRPEENAWGSGLLNMAEMKNMTRLAIESNPWEGGEYGVPYPTSFHPHNEHQLQEWQEFVRNKERGLVFSFAGATRKRIPNDFRLELLAQCSDSRGACSAMDCSDSKCETPEPVVQLFLNSTFCLQPRGDGYTRRSIFDSVLAGCIPVFFWNQSSYWQYKWFFPEEDESYSVFIDREDVRKGTKIMEVLSRFSQERVKAMRNTLIDALPKLVYATADHELSGADAFDTAIDGVLRSMLRMNLRLQKSSG
ncbi:xyloglucan galactosyltransferase XLT2-like [Selaginella moellendorffii]|uniref:xyloglucan galactosyltransferase XLT2-like n=1 Tax=Selaginella moellendorffii TaxID=88036 RepID=UPI000D1C809C|nr:xyloglucan galactosyltransferase XLT2-like [Selaginella moellendorffii]|eukprot:XP_024535442.1 xyloglucan galactosyltransferase XLT2-like [Selaginella moellendorffii]